MMSATEVRGGAARPGGVSPEVRWLASAGTLGPLEPGQDGAAKLPFGEAAVALAAEALDRGEVLVHPTCTVYGLGGRPRPEVDARIARLKGRRATPLIRLAGDRDALLGAIPGLVWTEEADRLAEAFWPGPLTLVLDDGTDTGVAVRIDAHPVILALLSCAGGVMTSTSLNRTGEAAARDRAGARAAIEALAGVRGRLGWLDAGDLPVSEASTLFSLRAGRRGMLRAGAIPADRLAAALGDDAGGIP